MINYHYIIPLVPPSNNKYIGKRNNWEYQKVKKEWAGYVDIFCRPKPTEPFERARVTLLYHFPDKRKRDPDNYSGKMILDGLVQAGIIIDDSFDVIDLLIKAAPKPDRKNPRVEIFIEEVSHGELWDNGNKDSKS